jgi:hypothetical protein
MARTAPKIDNVLRQSRSSWHEKYGTETKEVTSGKPPRRAEYDRTKREARGAFQGAPVAVIRRLTPPPPCRFVVLIVSGVVTADSGLACRIGRPCSGGDTAMAGNVAIDTHRLMPLPWTVRGAGRPDAAPRPAIWRFRPASPPILGASFWAGGARERSPAARSGAVALGYGGLEPSQGPGTDGKLAALPSR